MKVKSSQTLTFGVATEFGFEKCKVFKPGEVWKIESVLSDYCEKPYIECPGFFYGAKTEHSQDPIFR
jgi:hypothetical protein